MKRILLSTLSLVFFTPLFAQQVVTIAQIQGSGLASSLQGQQVSTTGIVTAKFQESGQIGAFFIQDRNYDPSVATSVGLFVYTRDFENFQVGDSVRVVADVKEYNGKTELEKVLSVTVLAEQLPLPYHVFTSPLQWPDWESLEGMLVCFPMRMYVNATNDLETAGQLGLSDSRRRAETESVIGKGDEKATYDSLLAAHELRYITLDDGRSGLPSPLPFVDGEGVLRAGQYVDTLWAIVDQFSSSKYGLYATKAVQFKGNPRTLAPDASRLGNYSLRISSFNIENYNGDNAQKRTKVVAAMKAMDADIFGLCEVRQGPAVIRHLVTGLNEAYGGEVYAFVDVNLGASTYTTVSFVYKKDRVRPVGNFRFINTPTPMYRKLLQAFEDVTSGTKFLLSLNHLKAKSGTGTGADADQGDGQAMFNAARIAEARAVLSAIQSEVQRSGIPNVLLMGDLNALANEEPIRIFKEAGFHNQSERYFADEYSYVFGGKIQYLDYVMANDSMARYISGATPWHINADELKYFQFDKHFFATPYRCADHDPVVVGLALGWSPTASQERSELVFSLYPNPSQGHFMIRSAEACEEVELCDISGRRLYYRRFLEPQTQLSIEVNVPSTGYYFLRLRGGDKEGSCKLLLMATGS